MTLIARRKASFFALTGLLSALAAATGAEAAEPSPWPTRAWAESSPEAQGLDAAMLEAFHREFAEGKHGYIDGMLVVRNGAVVFEKSYRHDYDKLFVGKGAPGLYNYYDPEWHPYWKRGDLHTMQSVSKSIASTLVGIAIRRGELPGVDAKLMPYFSAFATKADKRRDALTLRHVLTMTTGIQWDESSTSYTDAANNCAEMEARRDWIQYVLDQPMAEDPGKNFVYNSGATQLLSYLIKKATGKEADDYAKEQLFGPLGIEYAWKRTPLGLADTEGGLYLRSRDLAKIGLLFLKDGVWEGRRILPEGWVKEATAWIVDTRDAAGHGYGYKWWVLSRKGPGSYEAYAAIGYGGQRLIVVPELDLIGVFTGWNIHDKPSLSMDLALQRLVQAATAQGARASVSSTPATEATARIVASAQAFLASLSEADRAKVQFPFGGPQKSKWSNLPTGIFKREGLRLGDLGKVQRGAALALLSTAFSPDGYRKILEIMGGDEALRGPAGGPPRSGGVVFGEDEYYLAFLGAPSVSAPWMVQFGGHHLAINMTFAGPQATLAPSHTAAQPASYTLEGRTVRPLGKEKDRAFALMATLDEAQRSQAILGYRVADLVLGPGQDGRTIQPEGLKASALSATQQVMLVDLAREWVGIATDALSSPRMDEIRSGLPETYFAWSGPTTEGSAAYFRIQGPRLVIEYAPQRGVDHIHTIYRDPTNEYGARFVRE